MAFYILLRKAHTFFLNLQYIFFLAFAITRYFSTRAIWKSFQLFLVPFFFQVFLNLFTFIYIFLHSSSNPSTDFEDNFALGIARLIAISIALIRE